MTMAVPSRKLDGRARAEIAGSAPFDLGELLLADLVELSLAYARHADDVLVSHDDRIGAIDDGAHGELGLSRIADLPDQDEVERRLQRRRHFSSDRNAAARKRQHDNRVLRIANKGFRRADVRLRSCSRMAYVYPRLEGPERADDDNAFRGRNNPRR